MITRYRYFIERNLGHKLFDYYSIRFNKFVAWFSFDHMDVSKDFMDLITDDELLELIQISSKHLAAIVQVAETTDLKSV